LDDFNQCICDRYGLLTLFLTQYIIEFVFIKIE